MLGLIGAIAGPVIGGLLGGSAQKSAAKTAADTSDRASRRAIREQRRQFDKAMELVQPYVQAGYGALAGQQDLLGLSGPEAQQAAIDALAASPAFESMVTQGEEAILQNAAATGGLRGGNTQGALAQFRPQVLSQLIDQQYGRLSGLTGIGQASATGQAAAAQNLGSNVGNILMNQGNTAANAALARGNANANMWGNIGGTIGGIGTLAAMGAF